MENIQKIAAELRRVNARGNQNPLRITDSLPTKKLIIATLRTEHKIRPGVAAGMAPAIKIEVDRQCWLAERRQERRTYGTWRGRYASGPAAWLRGPIEERLLKSIRARKHAAAQRDSVLRLGWAARTGDKAALSQLKASGNKGDALAQLNLGTMYRTGEGVRRNAARAVRWFRKAADQGDASAQNIVGLMYSNWEGVPRDAVQALSWFRKAADQGLADAQFHLGFMYRTGEGVPRDTVLAASWYRKAADQGDAGAQFNLGAMYYLGSGVPKDFAEAASWYQKAANRGHARAQLNLGLMYEHGELDSALVLAALCR